LSNECIHGLADGRCAICFPKPVPEAEVAASAVRARRGPSSAKPASLRTAPAGASPQASLARPRPSTRAKSSKGPKSAPDNVGEQRIYHLTHITNLAGILNSGCLLADASDAWAARPAVDISSAPNREARRAALVSGTDGRAVAGFVPFFLSPNATLWDSIITSTDDPRLSRDAQRSEVFDFVILVSTVRKVIDAQAGAGATGAGAPGLGAQALGTLTLGIVAVADGDAAGTLTRFGATPESSERVLRRLRAEKDALAILESELLVEEAFPFELVTLVGVANDKVRDVVRGILASSGHRPKVAVYPPWFHASETVLA
jgi:hypothetical protein